MISGSTLHRTEYCPAWPSLPHVRVESEDATRGTIGHRYLERVAQVGPEAALAEVPESHREMCAAVDLDGLPLGSGYRQEVAFAYDVETGRARELGVGLGRNYGSISSTEIPCTLDVVGRAEDGVFEVADYKFDGFDATCPPPCENPQLLFGALCVALTSGVYAVRLRIIHVRPDGSHWIESAQVDTLDLDAFDARVRRIMERAQDARVAVRSGCTPDVARGPWCRYCPAAAACPAVTGLIRAVALEPVQTAEQVLALLTPETASRAYLRLQEIEAALKPVRAALHLYADEHPIALPDGRVYGPVTTTREEVDARVARKALAALYGPEVAEAAVDFDTSKAAIERALRAVVAAKKEAGEKVTLKAVVAEALAAIRAAGGTTQITKTTVREHKAGEKETA